MILLHVIQTRQCRLTLIFFFLAAFNDEISWNLDYDHGNDGDNYDDVGVDFTVISRKSIRT